MATHKPTRIPGRLSPPEYLSIIRAKLSRARDITRQAARVHRVNPDIDEQSLPVVGTQIDQALGVIGAMQSAAGRPASVHPSSQPCCTICRTRPALEQTSVRKSPRRNAAL